jgi:hypothetical protein
MGIIRQGSTRRVTAIGDELSDDVKSRKGECQGGRHGRTYHERHDYVGDQHSNSTHSSTPLLDDVILGSVPPQTSRDV